METYEKRYKDAQKWIESIYTELSHERQMEAEAFFPELKENEDGKNIKNLIDELKCSLRAANCQNEACNGGHEKRIALLEWAIAWLEKQVETKKPTRDQVWDYCSKISHEWWQIAMDKFNTLTDEERSKYNQFIGFNDFSDILMNITAGALFRLIDTCKLEYEEGSLLLEKPDDTPMPIETTNPIEEQDSQILANSAKTCK